MANRVLALDSSGLSCVNTDVYWRERISAWSSASLQSSPFSFNIGAMPILSRLCDFRHDHAFLDIRCRGDPGIMGYPGNTG